MTQNSVNTGAQVLQKLFTTTSSVVTCNTTMPADNTIPQNTEGNEVLTLSITPIYSTSRLIIEFSGSVNDDTNSNKIQVALFQDSNANALSAHSYFPDPTSAGDNCTLIHVMTSGTTSSTTFKIRVGPSANTCYVNGDQSGTRLMGGVSSTFLMITEII